MSRPNLHDDLVALIAAARAAGQSMIDLRALEHLAEKHEHRRLGFRHEH